MTFPGCRYCELFATDNRYRVLWGGQPIEGLKKRKKLDAKTWADAMARKRVALPQCPELGPPLTTPQMLALGVDPATCGCGGKIRACGLHDHCTTTKAREGMACCATCADHPSRQNTQYAVHSDVLSDDRRK